MNESGQLFFGGDIYTVDGERPEAEAVAVREGRIAAVGSRAECESALGGGFEPVDLRGRALLPGFIDTHIHPLVMVYYDMNLDLRGTASLDELKERIRAAAAGTGADGWVVGLQFEEQELSEARLPTRRELDEACADLPVLIIKHDGHMAIGNTRAIQAAGVDASTPDPENGTIDREPGGYPSGPFREEASAILKSMIPIPDPQAFIDGARSAFGRLAACGITSVGAVMQTDEEGPAGADGAFELPIMQMLLEHIPLGLYGILQARDIEKVNAALATGLNDEPAGRRIGAVKIFSDGTFGSCTAFMEEPFSDHPDTRGYLTITADELYRRMVMAHTAGFQLAVHAIGDAANRVCVDLYDRLLSEHPRDDHRHRLEHASQLSESLIEDIARLGLVVSTQPMYIHSEREWLGRRLGPARTRWTYPFRSLLVAGVRVAGASDAPIESTDVMHAIECCVGREGFEPEQGITATQAVRMYTIDAAYAQFEEGIKGSITPGKRADLVILSDNPTRVAPDHLRCVKVERTIAGGKVVYERED